MTTKPTNADDGGATTSPEAKPFKRKTVTVRCDMHRADIETEHPAFYQVNTADGEYKEHWSFCSLLCMLSWLIDDDQVLRLYAKRSELPREIKHPEGPSKMLIRESKDEGEIFYRMMVHSDKDADEEIIEPIDFNSITTMKQARKIFTKEECDAIPGDD